MIDSLTPMGYGNLSQGDVSMRLQTELFEIRALPLQEGVLRLLKPDTYNSFHSLMVRKEDEIQRAADRWGVRAPTLLLVTFFGRQREARFQPDILLVTSQNRVFRPVQIFPLSPQWNQNQVSQRETQTAVYMYPDGIRLQDAIELSYDRFATRAWAAIIRVLDSEWNAVQARAARDRQ
jgi:hypothetical protein